MKPMLISGKITINIKIVTNISCNLYNKCYNSNMSKIEKLIEKLLSISRDMEWSELVKLLNYFGFAIIQQGATGGSRRCFKNQNGIKIYFHEPHPSKIIKTYAIKQAVEILKKEGIL